MGNGDWAIETHVSLGDFSATDGYSFELMVGYDRYNQLWLDVGSDGSLNIYQTGVQGAIATVSGNPLPLYLRIQKVGAQYTFYYKQDTGDPDADSQAAWITLGTYNLGLPVQYVGLEARTYYTTQGVAVFNVDYFRLERYGPEGTPPAPYSETVQDDFNGPSLVPGWQAFLPDPGPFFSLTAVPGSLELSLPGNGEFWGLDHAPQLRRTDLGDGDWSIQTELTDITPGGNLIRIWPGCKLVSAMMTSC